LQELVFFLQDNVDLYSRYDNGFTSLLFWKYTGYLKIKGTWWQGVKSRSSTSH